MKSLGQYTHTGVLENKKSKQRIKDGKVSLVRKSIKSNRVGIKREKGITLIALILTIIVLLILAGISISMLAGNNSIIKNAQQAKADTERAELEERIKLAIMGAYDSTGSFNVEKLKTELNNLGATYSETETELLIDIPNGKQIAVEKGAEKEETTYTINYDANEGTVTPTSITAVSGAEITMPTPTREGYTFNGWYTAKTGGTKVEYTTMPEKNETVYAGWTFNGLVGKEIKLGDKVYCRR